MTPTHSLALAAALLSTLTACASADTGTPTDTGTDATSDAADDATDDAAGDATADTAADTAPDITAPDTTADGSIDTSDDGSGSTCTATTVGPVAQCELNTWDVYAAAVCDCLTPTEFAGDRTACEAAYPPSEPLVLPPCVFAAFTAFESEVVASTLCAIEARQTQIACIAECATTPTLVAECQATFDAADTACRSTLPEALNEAISACDG